MIYVEYSMNLFMQQKLRKMGEIISIWNGIIS